MTCTQLGAIIFFIAFVQMMYYLGVMQWVIKHLYVSFMTLDIRPLNLPQALGCSSSFSTYQVLKQWLQQPPLLSAKVHWFSRRCKTVNWIVYRRVCLSCSPLCWLLVNVIRLCQTAEVFFFSSDDEIWTSWVDQIWIRRSIYRLVHTDVTMTSGFSTIAGSVLIAYINLGVPPQNLVTSSVMSIPASISISKIRLPETEEPVTRGHVTVDRGEKAEDKPVCWIYSFAFLISYVECRQTLFMPSLRGLFSVLSSPAKYCKTLRLWISFYLAFWHSTTSTNVLTVLSLVATYVYWIRIKWGTDYIYRINGLLTWIGRGFGIHHLTLELIIGYIFYPVTFFLSVPRAEILRVSQLFATKLVANEFAAYLDLQAIMKTNPLSPRAYTIASYGLCGFANLGSLGIQIGVLSALAPSRGRVIARIALSAMVCGFLSTLQTAGIVYVLSSPALISMAHYQLSSGMLVWKFMNYYDNCFFCLLYHDIPALLITEILNYQANPDRALTQVEI